MVEHILLQGFISDCVFCNPQFWKLSFLLWLVFLSTPLHQSLESTGMFYFQNKAFRSTYQYLTRKRRIQVKLVRQKCGEWGGLITLLSGSPWPTGERRSSLRVWEEMPEWRQGGCPALRRWGAIWSSHRECTLRVCWFAQIDLRKFSTTKS